MISLDARKDGVGTEDLQMVRQGWCRGVLAAGMLILLTGLPLRGQVEMTERGNEVAPGFVYLDAIAFAGAATGEARLDVFLQVGYEGLSFVKEDDLYHAAYEVTLTLTDSAGGIIGEKLWTEEVKGVTFERSISTSAYSLVQRSFPVPRGTYELTASVRDRESKGARSIRAKIAITDFSAFPFALSDLLLINRVTEQGGRRSIVPNVSSNLAETPGAFSVYVEIYNRRPIDSVTVVSSIVKGSGEALIERDSTLPVRAGKDEKILTIPYGDLPIGDYRLVLRAYPAGAKTTTDSALLAMTNRAVHVRWQGMPESMKDLNVAIEQIRYIATSSEYDSLADATTPAEKQRLFLKFWKGRDPNPNTERNEKMEEYYARAAYADRHFSHYVAGWKTDRGMIYMMFGPPNNVDRHPFDIDAKPYEVWSYFEISYSFAFLDETGFGDYRLVTPLWEVYNRYRR
jgi:GWxTD domain-containing protein